MGMTVGQAIDTFAMAKQIEGRSPKTTQWYRNMLERFGQHAPAGLDQPVRDVGLDDARSFVAQLQSREQRYEDHPFLEPRAGGLSPNTIHGYVRALKAFGCRRRASWRTIPLASSSGPMTYEALSTCNKALGERAGIPRLHAHLFRHTFAVHYLMNGGGVMSLKRILGHATLDVTQVYIHLAEQHAKVQHSRFSPVDRLGLGVRRRRRGKG